MTKEIKREIKKDILNKIKKGEIKKTSPWFFITKNYFFKLLFMVSIILGSFGFSSALVQLFRKPHNHMDLSFSEGLINYFLVSAPYLWIVFLIIFTAIGWFNFKNISGGYKKNNSVVILVSVAISLVLGYILFVTGAGERMDDSFKKNSQYYKNFQELRMKHRERHLDRVMEDFPEEKRKEILDERREKRGSS